MRATQLITTGVGKTDSQKPFGTYGIHGTEPAFRLYAEVKNLILAEKNNSELRKPLENL